MPPDDSRCANKIRPLLLSLTLLTGIASAQVLEPVTADISVAFSNPAGAVRNRLVSASGPGMMHFSATGRTTEAVPRVAGMTTAVAAGTRTSASGALTLDASGSPSWTFQATAVLDHYNQQFYFTSTEPPVPVPVEPGGGPYAHSFSRSVSIVEVNFGAPVSGGVILLSSPDHTVSYGQVNGMPAGSTNTELVVPGGVPLLIEAALETGSGGETGSLRRVARRITTWTGPGGVPDNTIQTVSLNLAEAATLGSFTGTFDIIGADELPVASGGNSLLPGWSRIGASYFSANLSNYGNWRRLAVLNSGSASGSFTLGNLPSTASIAANDAGSSYGLQGEALLRRTLPSGGLGVQSVRTRLLTAAEVPAVPAGGSASLGSRFTITPAVVRGTLQLRGPNPVPGQPAMLGGIVTAADTDSNNDGLPEGLDALEGGLWSYRSGIFSNTVINNNSGYGGTGWQIMERTWSAPDANCEYDIALANPNNESRDWTHPGLSLVMQNSSALENEYFDTQWYAQKRDAAPVNGAPGTVTTRNDSVDTGEVTIIVRSAAGSGVNIWQPRLYWLENGLTGDSTNTWDVSGIVAYGWPATSAGATGRASLRTLLPAGTYTVRPTVLSINGLSTLAPFTITVPARGRLTVDNGLVLNAFIPPCVGGAGTLIYAQYGGGVASSVQYSVDGGPLQNASHFMDAVYTLNLPGGLPAGVHTVTVIVTTVDGRTASQTHQFEVDLTPPVITCPANMDIYANFLTPQVVNYPSPVATDNCGGPVTVVCNPPSGSVFPFGTTSVSCTATDAAGNSAGGFFNITVHPPCPPPVRSHRYSAASGTHFRYQDENDWHDTAAMTITAWVKRESTSACETIIAQNYQQSFWFGFCSVAGNLRFYRSGGTFADSTGTVPSHQWTHVAVTYDGVMARFYIDAEPAGAVPLTSNGMGNGEPVTIGGDFTEGAYNYGFTGLLDEIKIYGRELGALEIPNSTMKQQIRGGLDLEATFGAGGSVEDILSIVPQSISAIPPAPELEGMLPRYMVVPRVTGHTPGVDGEVDTATEYANADKMVIRYRDGANGIHDAVAYFKYQDDPGDRALYIGVKNVRDVIAPWTRAQSWVAVQMDEDASTFGGPHPADLTDFRFNSRRLDGSLSAGIGTPPTGFERGDGAGNYGPLPPGDPLHFTPTPFGLIGAGGDTVEFRFDLSTLGGDWSKAQRIGVSHHWISGIGVDANGPIGAAFEISMSWADVSFSGQLPQLSHLMIGSTMHFEWLDPACNYLLECSSTMEPFSWAPINAPRLLNFRDDILRTATFDTGLHPRKFFRLRR